MKEVGDNPDSTSMYRVAEAWYATDSNRKDAMEVFHHLADFQEHILSCSKLGHHYAKNDLQQAVKYFARAGENGPHHPSLYNAGRLLAELGDWVGSMAYLRSAATMSESYPPKLISDDTTASSKKAYEMVSEQVYAEELSIIQAADIFIFGSLQDLPEEARYLWTSAVVGLVRVNQNTNGQIPDQEVMEEVMGHLKILWETYGSKGLLSKLQTYLLLDNINDMLGPLARLNDTFRPMAVSYAKALATFRPDRLHTWWKDFDEL